MLDFITAQYSNGMTLPDGSVARNLEAQVLKNKEDIAAHYNMDRVLADFGIRVIGRLNSAEELEGKEGSDYGDAYVIGVEPPYSFYVWTRADVNSGQLNDYWLDLGPLAIVGPKGETGPQGPQGVPGTAPEFMTGNLQNLPSDVPLNSIYLRTAGNDAQIGDVYQLGSGGWGKEGNIRGPQGVQGIQGPIGPRGERGPEGPKGDTGDVGGFINIYGIVSNVGELPTPASLNNLTVAYLVGAAEPYNLFVQIGSTSDTAYWQNMGPLNVATYVTVNGEFQNVWNADTKLDKVYNPYSDTSARWPIIPVIDANQNVTFRKASAANVMGETSIVYRNAQGNFFCAYPTSNFHVAPMKYVEDRISKVVSELARHGIYITV